jgi:hypothetical protein
MGTIKKSVKQMIINFLEKNGQSNLKSITNYVLSEREIHPSHVRGVLNADVKKNGRFFCRDSRGIYSLSYGRTKEEIVVNNSFTEEVMPTVPTVE